MPERAEGFYWVAYTTSIGRASRTEIAEWSDCDWWLTGRGTEVGEDFSITVLSERLEPPKETNAR